MARTKQPKERLQRMAEEHLFYELQMFHSTAIRLGSNLVQQNVDLRNNILESLAVHIRVLFKFFFDKPSKDSDVVASDFYPDENSWHDIREKIGHEDEVSSTCRRVNKEVAHLTWDRLDVKPEEKGWLAPGELAYNLISEAFSKFLVTVPEDTLGDKMVQEKRRVTARGNSRPESK